MSATIKYAYLKDRTWIYRRNYPKDVALVLGIAALKQSLKTGDTATARVRTAELNAHYEQSVSRARTLTANLVGEAQRGAVEGTPPVAWLQSPTEAVNHLRAALQQSGGLTFATRKPRVKVYVGDIGREYLNRRSNDLRPSGFKSVRYSVGLFLSKYGSLDVADLGRDQGREFLSLISQLSPVIGRSERTRGLTLDQLVRFTDLGPARITARTQRRIWSQVNHFVDWLVYEGHVTTNPFRSVRFDQKVRPAPYAVPTNEQVLRLLGQKDPVRQPVLLTCFLTGMRAGEAVGLRREDVVSKGNLGRFIHVRPN